MPKPSAVLSPAPLTYDQRRALGLHARRQLARKAHAAFNLAACPSAPLDLLFAVERTRVQSLIPIKHQRMAASPFGFYRGAVPIMAADLSCQPHTGLLTQLCGDAHVLNLGAFEAPDGRLVFDINDFDETIRGPFEWDIKRMATAIILAGREAGVRRAARRAAVLHFVANYRRAMHAFAAMPVLELARHQIHRLPRVPAIAAILKNAQRSTPLKTLVKLTTPARGQKLSAGARHFVSAPPLLHRVTGEEAQQVLAALVPYALTLEPQRRHFLAQYRTVDVGFKVVGTGSVGTRDYCIYFEGTHHPAPVKSLATGVADPLFLQIKEEPHSAYALYLPGGDTHAHQGQRVVDGQRAMQLTSDPFLGYTSIPTEDGPPRDYLVRQLNDHKAGLDMTGLTAQGLEGYADVCGELLARGHARAGDPVALAAYLGTSTRFDTAILTFARAYADKTERDWETFCKWLKPTSAKKTAEKSKPAKSKPAKKKPAKKKSSKKKSSKLK
jgi:uncharacterized protein (DUF2252 family)